MEKLRANICQFPDSRQFYPQFEEKRACCISGRMPFDRS